MTSPKSPFSPKVSVIIPNYHHAQYLKERIESVLNQSFQDFELIILDDNSPDNSIDIINEYASNPLVSHIIINEENSGNTFIQWERGINIAKGEYIWIAESDDKADSTFLESLVSKLDETSNAVFALCGSHSIDGNNNIIDKDWDRWDKDDGTTSIFNAHDYAKHNLTFGNLVYNASMVLFRKEYYSFISEKYKALKQSGDWLFWFELSTCCPNTTVILHRKKLNYFRQHQQKVSSKAEQNGELAIASIYASIEIIKSGILDDSPYLKKIIKGSTYKIAQRGHFDKNPQQNEIVKNNLFTLLYKETGTNRWHYILERINKTLSSIFHFLPSIRTYYYK